MDLPASPPATSVLGALLRVQAFEELRTGNTPADRTLIPSVLASLALPLPSPARVGTAEPPPLDLLTLRAGIATASLLRGLPAEELARHPGFGHPTRLELGLLAPVPRAGPSLEVASGAALAFRLRREPRVALLVDEPAATETGDWHEGVNFAAAQRVPLLVLMTPAAPDDPRAPRPLCRKATAWGVRSERVSLGDPGRLLATLIRRVGELRREPATHLIEVTAAPEGTLERFMEELIRRGELTEGRVGSLRAEARREAERIFGGIAA